MKKNQKYLDFILAYVFPIHFSQSANYTGDVWILDKGIGWDSTLLFDVNIL